MSDKTLNFNFNKYYNEFKPQEQVQNTWRDRVAPRQPERKFDTTAELYKQISTKDMEIAQLRLQNEAMVTALYRAGTGSNSPDEVEIAHRILYTIKNLRTENDMYKKKFNSSYAAQLETELDATKRALDMLKRGMHC